MSNLFSEGSALAQQYGDLRGAIVTRRQLFADNLDNGPDPDPAAVYPPDIFKIDRKGLQNAKVIEFELASVLDQPGVSLPGRQVLRDVCPFTYRVWNGTGFDYAGEDGCPYNAVAMFDADGNAVINGALDVCSHQLKTGCRARYGRDEETPFGGFPMVGRLRQ
jgi:lambda family phage minor tail protein L